MLNSNLQGSSALPLKNMTLEIAIEDYQKIRAGLLELPAKEVIELIGKLDKQVLEQNKPTQTKQIPMANVGE